MCKGTSTCISGLECLTLCCACAEGGDDWAGAASTERQGLQRAPAQLGSQSQEEGGHSVELPAAGAMPKAAPNMPKRGGSMQDLGIKVLKAAQTVADRTGFESTSLETAAVDGAIGEVMYGKFKAFDEQFLQPVFGGGERESSGTDLAVSPIAPATAEEDDADGDRGPSVFDGGGSDAI